MTGYRFKGVPKRTRRVKASAVAQRFVPEAEVIGTLQGIVPGSKEEWRVGVALNRLGYKYEFQYSVFGGRMAGGQVIDFWVTSTFLPTPVYVNGRAWHDRANARIDDFKLAKLKNIYRGRIREPVVIWDDTVGSIEAAMQVLRRLM
jgi:hypothetical protein